MRNIILTDAQNIGSSSSFINTKTHQLDMNNNNNHSSYLDNILYTSDYNPIHHTFYNHHNNNIQTTRSLNNINHKYHQIQNQNTSNNNNNNKSMNYNRKEDELTYNYNNSYKVNENNIDIIRNLTNKVELLVDELQSQIQINKDIMIENQRIKLKYNVLKSNYITQISNSKQNLNDTLLYNHDELQLQQSSNHNGISRNINKLQNQENHIRTIQNNNNKDNNQYKYYNEIQQEEEEQNHLHEQELKQKLIKIKQENKALRKKLGINESDNNNNNNNNNNNKQSPLNIKKNQMKKENNIVDVVVQEKKNKFKNMKSDKVLEELMNPQNLQNIQNEINNTSFSFLDDTNIPNEQQDKQYSLNQCNKIINGSNNNNNTEYYQKINNNKNNNSHLLNNSNNKETKNKITKQCNQNEDNKRNQNYSYKKIQKQQNQYSFGNQNAFNSSQISEENLDDIVNYYPKHSYVTPNNYNNNLNNYQFIHSIKDFYGHSKYTQPNQLSHLDIQFKL